MPNRPSIRRENDPVKRLRELRAFCLANAPASDVATYFKPFDLMDYVWEMKATWDCGKGATIDLDILPKVKSIRLSWPGEFSSNPNQSSERARQIIAVANLAVSVQQMMADWNTKYWPQNPGKRIADAANSVPAAEGGGA